MGTGALLRRLRCPGYRHFGRHDHPRSQTRAQSGVPQGVVPDRGDPSVRGCYRNGRVFQLPFGREPGPGPQRSYREGDDWVVLVAAQEDHKLLTRRITIFRRVGELYRRDYEVHRLRLFKGPEHLVVASIKLSDLPEDCDP